MLSRIRKPSLLFLFLVQSFCGFTQEDDLRLMVGVFGGLVSYQGDLQPNSFTFKHSKSLTSIWLRKPLNAKFSVRGGVSMGKLNAADANNRDYLKIRNLSFATDIKEAYLVLDYALLDLNTTWFTPFAYGGVVVFHFDPYTMDGNKERVYLQPLGTEGQGLAAYPDRKPYKLTQPALAFGGGFRFAVNNNLNLSLEASQRKSFTDYIDDVSKSYADQNKLMMARGPKAVELAYRGDELSNGSPYPPEGEQRGTPTEMDWYYFIGVSAEVKLNAIGQLFRFSGGLNKRYASSQRCPRFY